MGHLTDLAQTAINDLEQERHRHWWIYFPAREPVEVIFEPGITHKTVLLVYPNGVSAELFQNGGFVPRAPEIVPTLDPPPLVPDDRRPCTICLNLAANGCCRAATRGELPFAASRKYSPVPGVPKRCESYLPRPNDADRRPGRERWPALIEPPADAVRRQQ